MTQWFKSEDWPEPIRLTDGADGLGTAREKATGPAPWPIIRSGPGGLTNA